MSDKVCEIALTLFNAIDGANSRYGQLYNLTWTDPDDCFANVVNSVYEYPLVELITKNDFDLTPVNTVKRNIHFFVAHSGFFLFNLINCSVMLLFHGYAFERWSKNPMIKWCFLGCFFQMISCITGLIRFGNNDEMGHHTNVVHWSNLTSVFAYWCMNYVHTLILVNGEKQKRPELIKYHTIFSIGSGMVIFCATVYFFERDNFKYIRPYFFLSSVYQLVAYFKGAKAFRTKQINLPADFCFDNKIVWRIFVANMLLVVLSLLMGYSKLIVLQYPGTGLTFSCMMIVMTFFGEMDFMSPHFRL